MPSYTSQYPPAYNDTYIKTTSAYGAPYLGYATCNPVTPLIGDWAGWLSDFGAYNNQRFHIDLGEAKVIARIYYENQHNSDRRNNYHGRSIHPSYLQDERNI